MSHIWDRMFSVTIPGSILNTFTQIFVNKIFGLKFLSKFSGNFLCSSKFSQHIFFKFYVNKFLDSENFRRNFSDICFVPGSILDIIILLFAVLYGSIRR